MKKFSLIALLFFAHTMFAQEVELLKEGSSLPRIQATAPFNFLHHDVDTTTMMFVGTFRAYGVGAKSTIEKFYNLIRAEALKNGANSFRLVTINRAEATASGELVLETYFSSDEVIVKSKRFKEKNVVFVFSSELRSEQHTTSFRVNNEKQELHGGKYVRYELPAGEELKISKGGVIGASAIFAGKEGREALYLSLSGLGVGPGVGATGNGVGVSFNAGSVNQMDQALGELLTIVLERVQ